MMYREKVEEVPIFRDMTWMEKETLMASLDCDMEFCRALYSHRA